ncbi:unnamed protein product [Fraxinus pennsylvanica]|uniref:Uncharacterized protein n=1 Tax=Fraxinus pennsylvanica TaxID=56036 RepID=A0AAD2E993_9LAMI|nr:unnamed protein product [Fraxinus pennsylvanica]
MDSSKNDITFSGCKTFASCCRKNFNLEISCHTFLHLSLKKRCHESQFQSGCLLGKFQHWRMKHNLCHDFPHQYQVPWSDLRLQQPLRIAKIQLVLDSSFLLKQLPSGFKLYSWKLMVVHLNRNSVCLMAYNLKLSLDGEWWHHVQLSCKIVHKQKRQCSVLGVSTSATFSKIISSSAIHLVHLGMPFSISRFLLQPHINTRTPHICRSKLSPAEECPPVAITLVHIPFSRSRYKHHDRGYVHQRNHQREISSSRKKLVYTHLEAVHVPKAFNLAHNTRISSNMWTCERWQSNESSPLLAIILYLQDEQVLHLVSVMENGGAKNAIAGRISVVGMRG